MPRKLTPDQMRKLRQSVTQQESSDVKIFLVTFTQGDSKIRVCSQGLRRLTVEDYQTYRTAEEAVSYEANLDRVVMYGLVSKDRLFEQAGFAISLCEDSEGTVPSVQLTIPNVGRAVIEQIEKLANKPVKVDIELIFADEPDDIIMSLEGFDMTNIRYDDDQITGTITRELLFKEPIPSHRFSPTNFRFLGW
jgi:hypothetical protein